MWLCRELEEVPEKLLGCSSSRKSEDGANCVFYQISAGGPHGFCQARQRHGEGETGNKEVDGCLVLSCEFTGHLQPSPVTAVLVAFRPAAAFTSRTSGTSLYLTH